MRAEDLAKRRVRVTRPSRTRTISRRTSPFITLATPWGGFMNHILQLRLFGPHTKETLSPRLPASAGRFLTGPDFLPAPGTLAGLENLLAQADGSGGNFDEFVIGNKLDGLLEAQLAVRD